MCFILSFNRFILVPLLCEWIKLTEYVCFESAVSNHLARNQLLDIVEQYSHIFQNELFAAHSRMVLSIRLLKWCLSRHFCFSNNLILEVQNGFLKQLQRLSPKDRADLLRCCTIGNGIDSNRCAESLIPYLTELFSNMPVLKSASFTSCSSVNTALFSLSRSSQHLRSLILSTCRKLKDETFIMLAVNLIYLEELKVDHCEGLTGVSMRCVVVNCPRLSVINWQYGYNNKKRDIAMLALHLRGRLIQFSYDGFTDLTLKSFIWYQGSQLQKFDLSFSNYVTDLSAVLIGQVCPRIVDLNISYCGRITELAVTNIANSLPRLEAISFMDLDKMTNNALCTITRKCSALKELHICESYSLSDAGLLTIGQMCTQLTKLTFASIPLSDETLLSIVSQCHCLNELDLSENAMLTDTALTGVVQMTPLLRKLHVSHCVQLTDVSLQAIAEYCRDMRDLSIGFCDLVGDTGLEALLKGCTMLSSLDLNSCLSLTESGIECIGEYGRSLKYLNIRVLHSVILAVCLVRNVCRLVSLRQLVTSMDASLFESHANWPDLFISEYNCS